MLELLALPLEPVSGPPEPPGLALSARSPLRLSQAPQRSKIGE